MILILIAIILPWLTFLLIQKPWQALLALLLQGTLFGWPIASIWAITAAIQYRKHKKEEAKQEAEQSEPTEEE